MNPKNDLTLWRDFKNGSRESLDEIFQQHVRFLYDYAYRLSSDHNLAQDCIQDLFVTLWTTRENLSDTDNIKFYLMKSLRRGVVRSIAHEGKLGTKEAISENFDFIIEFSHEFHLINDQLTMERKDQLKSALELLTKRQREAVYHKYYNNLSNNEIAEVMALSINSVYNLMSKALEVLSENLKRSAKLIRK